MNDNVDAFSTVTVIISYFVLHMFYWIPQAYPARLTMKSIYMAYPMEIVRHPVG